MLELQVKVTKELHITVQVDENNDNDYEVRTIDVPNGNYTVSVYDNVVVITLIKRI